MPKAAAELMLEFNVCFLWLEGWLNVIGRLCAAFPLL